jgi:hypothetical protein
MRASTGAKVRVGAGYRDQRCAYLRECVPAAVSRPLAEDRLILDIIKGCVWACASRAPRSMYDAAAWAPCAGGGRPPASSSAPSSTTPRQSWSPRTPCSSTCCTFRCSARGVVQRVCQCLGAVATVAFAGAGVVLRLQPHVADLQGRGRGAVRTPLCHALRSTQPSQVRLRQSHWRRRACV